MALIDLLRSRRRRSSFIEMSLTLNHFYYRCSQTSMLLFIIFRFDCKMHLHIQLQMTVDVFKREMGKL